jgi:hypothetical protein
LPPEHPATGLQNNLIWKCHLLLDRAAANVQITAATRASYASGGGGGGGASRVRRIAGDVTAGSALVSCVLVGYAPCAERRRF